ncbi:hypothetical protein [Olsenella massiliensis]|uniref:hypothetical protein n=1 Tax=Olsenella massiliensis TaxID=1622075 RepID=UPI0011DE3A63|nr:hypothetical protein [Olsenella massiliensis]
MDMTQREIGGYFELERFSGREYHEGALALNCARSCLAYLVEARAITSMWVPRYLCGSVEATLLSLGVRVRPYDVAADLRPDYGTVDVSENDYLYLVDYYGQLLDQDIREAAGRCDGRIVIDEVMAFFRRPLPHLDTLYSCRKFFGVADGAYLYTDARVGRELPSCQSYDKMGFVLARCELPANDHYPESAANNKRFVSEPVSWMSPITHNILRAVDYADVATRRQENFDHLAKRLDGMNELAVRSTYGAFMYPLLIEGGAALRRRLQEQRLYVSTLWGNATELPGVAGRYAKDILPLPVDQRYTTDDMDYECELIARALASDRQAPAASRHHACRSTSSRNAGRPSREK